MLCKLALLKCGLQMWTEVRTVGLCVMHTVGSHSVKPGPSNRVGLALIVYKNSVHLLEKA